MGCCGRARANLGVSRAAIASPQTTVAGSSRQPGLNQPVLRKLDTTEVTPRLRYLGQASIVVHGPVTGQRYAFSAANPVQPVDLRDAGILVRSDYFRQT